ncbi:MAG: branched-chain amino acid ABC transporter permease, partial [Desulfobacteraceae bacterium]|nr:branched-chain amino acid ABC transporter permease [Desulfobacteraceae bacterium]
MEDIFGQLSQQAINGITIGGVYALIAIGYTMVYGVLSMLNFAHGELYMIGGFTGWWVLQIFSVNHVPVMNAALLISLMIILSMGISALLGLLIERIAYRPLRNAPRMNLLLSSLGVSIFIQNFILYFQGAKVKVFHISHLIPEGVRTFHIGGVVISFMRILVIVICFILMVLLTLIIKKTNIGKSIRATAQD